MIDFPASPSVGQQFTAAGVTWTWDGVKWTSGGSGAAYLPLAGGTLTGPLLLAADPAVALGAATKQYVDANAGGGASAAPAGQVNKFRNGAMDVWQRGTSAIIINNGATGYIADGWLVNAVGVGITSQQGPGNSNTLWSLKVFGGTGLTALNISQRVESSIAAPLGVVPVTVQALVYTGQVTTVTPTISVSHATVKDTFSTVAVDLAPTNLQPCPNGVWTRVAYTFTVPKASAQLGLAIIFGFGAQVSGAANYVQITECDIRVTPGVATGLNNAPPAAELRDVSYEMMYCQRYFRWVPYNMQFQATAAQTLSASMVFQPAMRAAPTMSTVAADPNLTPTSVNTSASAFDNMTTYGARMALNSTASGTCYLLGYRASANAEL